MKIVELYNLKKVDGFDVGIMQLGVNICENKIDISLLEGSKRILGLGEAESWNHSGCLADISFVTQA